MVARLPIPRRRQAGVIIAIVLLAFNLRLALAAINPLIPSILKTTGLPASVVGLLLSIPYVCFGLAAPLIPGVSRRLGDRRTLSLALVVLTGGILIRSAPPQGYALFAGTLVMAFAITAANVLLPGVIRRDVVGQEGAVLGVYITVVTAGIAVGSAVTVPLMHSMGWGWQTTLAVMAAGTTLSALTWYVCGRGAVGRSEHVRLPQLGGMRRLYRDSTAWLVTIFFGLQSLAYSAVVPWIPSLLVARGVSQANAGFMLALVSIAGMVTTLFVPILAVRALHQKSLVIASLLLLSAGLAGLLAGPISVVTVYITLFGLGQGAAYGVSLSFLLVRTSSSEDATALAAMSQSWGYLVTAIGPVGFGLIHQLTRSWAWPLVFVLCVLGPLLVVGLGAARNRLVAAEARI